MEERNEGECSARAVREWSEGGSPKRNPEGDVGDLCSMHKGLAEFLKYEERLNPSVCISTGSMPENEHS